MVNDRQCGDCDCNQGRECPARLRSEKRLSDLVFYAAFVAGLMTAAGALAIWLAKWGAV